MNTTLITSLITALENNVEKVVFGKKEVIRLCLVALFAGEHVLLEDRPGVGKTLIGRAIAKSVSGVFRRLQFTPDLLPADITGSSIFDSRTHDFRFCEGPLFANLLLADEINRTPPRTQSAMLEAMNEQQVSVDGKTYILPKPFMVIATENPLEYEGTYQLPESQLDRFLIRISVGYPDRENELQILRSHRRGHPIDSLQSVLSCEQIIQIQQAVSEVRIDDAIYHYVLELVDATRNDSAIQVGASTRGAIAFTKAIQAFALIEGRDYAIPDDVKTLAIPVLSHRIMPKGFAQGNNRLTAELQIERLLENVVVPT
ncbi:MAG: AAA family ATPase [Thermoguttaceae bacterium]